MKTTNLNQELMGQYILAGSPKATLGQLGLLANHFCDKIGLRVAENPRTSIELLFNLSRDANQDVRVAVAGNRNCDRATLMRLVRDKDIVVRHAIAQNIFTPLFCVHDEVGARRQMKQEKARTTKKSFDHQTTETEAVS